MKIAVDLDVNEMGTLFMALGAWCNRLEKHGDVPDFYWSLMEKLTAQGESHESGAPAERDAGPICTAGEGAT